MNVVESSKRSDLIMRSAGSGSVPGEEGAAIGIGGDCASLALFMPGLENP
jgi:hypothetical protein